MRILLSKVVGYRIKFLFLSTVFCPIVKYSFFYVAKSLYLRFSIDSSVLLDNSEEQKYRFADGAADEDQTGKDEKQIEECDSEDTQSEDVDRPHRVALRSDNNRVYSTDEKRSGGTRKESRQDAEEADDVDNHPNALDQPSKKTASADLDADYSDNEPLVLIYSYLSLSYKYTSLHSNPLY